VKGYRFAGYSRIRFVRPYLPGASVPEIASGVAENLRMQSDHNDVSAEDVLSIFAAHPESKSEQIGIGWRTLFEGVTRGILESADE